MSRALPMLGAILVSAPLSDLACAHAQRSPSASVTADVDSTPVAMELLANVPFVRVLLNGRGPFLFMVDTGATITALDKGLVAELGLTLERNSGGTGMRDASAVALLPEGTVQIDEITVGKTRFKGIRAVVLALREPKALRRFSFAGVLGLNLFRGTTLILDYPALALSVALAPLAPADGRQIFRTFRADTGWIGVDVEVAGATRGFVLDSGAPEGIAMSLDMARRHRFQSEFKWVGQSLSAGNVVLEDKVARLQGDAVLGRYVLHQPAVLLANQPGIGGALLRQFKVTIDLESERVELERAGDEPIPTNSWRVFGVKADYTGPRPLIVETHPGLPAATLLRAGDIVTKIDGVDSSGVDGLFDGILQERDVLHLTIQRAGAIVIVDLPATRIPP